MFRVQCFLLPESPLLQPQDGPVECVEVWRPADDGIPMPDGTLRATLDGMMRIFLAGQWREDKLLD